MNQRETGFTLIELMIALFVFMIVLLGLGHAAHTSLRASNEVAVQQLAMNQAQSFTDRIYRLNFGETTDPNPTTDQLDELFDDDQDFGNVSLVQLSRYPTTEDGWKFSLSDFPTTGEWMIQVDQDLDDDGVVLGALEEDGNIFRVRIYFEDALYLSTNRAKEVRL